MITVVMNFKYIMGASFTRLRLRFHKVSFVISTIFFTFAWDTVWRLHYILCWSISALHICCVSAFCYPQNSVPGVRPSWDQKCGSWRVLNWDCTEDEREHHPLVAVTPLCTDRCVVWWCHAGGGLVSSSGSAVPFTFIVWTYLISAHIGLNWLWRFFPRIISN